MIDLQSVKPQLFEHAEQTYPNECCGALLGKMTGEIKVISEIIPIENAGELDKQAHWFVIEPDDVMRAERTAMKKGLDVLGFYHSHPEHTSEPSKSDRENAMPVWSYPIVSVKSGKSVEVRSWLLADDRESFFEEEIL